MTMRRVCAATALGCAALLPARAFLNSILPAAAAPGRETRALRGSAEASDVQGAPSFAGVAGAGAVLAATAAAAVVRRTARRAVRRDLAIAYQDSGIELYDNGKFAQGLVGADGAWGRYEYDPLGLSRWTEFVPYFREAELKHGRICMLAWIGLVAPDFFRIPGERYSFEAVPVTIDAHDALNQYTGVNLQIVFWISLVEICTAKKVFEWNSLEVAGDYGLGHQFLPKDEEGQKAMRTKELKNGRLAMVAFGGAITQAVITRHPFPWLF